VHFHSTDLIFGEFQQENSYISASDERILDQRPGLDRLLNSTIELLRANLDLRAKYWPKVAPKPKVAKKIIKYFNAWFIESKNFKLLANIWFRK
jgi:hypothetical protein